MQLYLVNRSVDESEILNDARLYDELEVDDAWAADSDSGDSGEEEVGAEGDADDEDAAAHMLIC